MKMKNFIKRTALAFTMLLAIAACQDDDHTFGDASAPGGLQVVADIVGKDATHPNGDGTGMVNFTATSENAITYNYIFSDETSTVAPSGVLKKRFSTPGLHSYTVTVIANGKGGLSSSTSFEIMIQSDFGDEEAVQFLTGGTSKKWYWAANEVGHLGVGPNNDNATENYFGKYYQALPFEKAGSPNSDCLYENELTFSLVGGVLKFGLNNGGRTFFNKSFLAEGGGTAGGPDDLCLNYPTDGLKTVTLTPSDSKVPANLKRGTVMNFSDHGFMGYYINQTTYEIMSITENRMVVRAIMGGDESLAWYHTFTTTKPVQAPPPAEENFTNLVFSDEFNTDGAPDSSKWNYNTGGSGWGNNEAQYYTNSAQNIVVSGGTLKITARKETMGGMPYTSARIVSEGHFDFKYGKAVIRAKLPSGGGTWPAIWMLGSNYNTNTWPACGEIDIMEHVANDLNKIHGSLHYPGHSGGNPDTGTTVINTATSAFHDYSVVWSATSIRFYVDDVLFHSFTNTAATPFNANFFLILNLAMGGNFGGAIDPAVTQATMEVDYVKVYQ